MQHCCERLLVQIILLHVKANHIYRIGVLDGITRVFVVGRQVGQDHEVFELRCPFLRSPKQISAIFLLSLPIWLSEALMYLLVGYSFGLNEVIPGVVHLASVILLVTAVANLSIAFPSSPGGIGPFEFFTLTILLLVTRLRLLQLANASKSIWPVLMALAPQTIVH